MRAIRENFVAVFLPKAIYSMKNRLLNAGRFQTSASAEGNFGANLTAELNYPK